MFEFENIGYVKDDDKDNLDEAAMLAEMKKSQREANKQRTAQGMGALEVVGWKKKPFYNPATNNLEWALRLRQEDGQELVNYKTKVLGRRGVMDVVVVCDEEQMDEAVEVYQGLLKGFAFNEEETYAAFTKGDRVAEYGLTGLIVGGGLLMAAKSGLLAKFWKPIAAVLVGLGLLVKRIFTGKAKNTI